MKSRLFFTFLPLLIVCGLGFAQDDAKVFKLPKEAFVQTEDAQYWMDHGEEYYNQDSKPRWRRTMEKDMEKDKVRTEILYDELGADLYNAIWQPLEKALQGVTTVYYSPSGQLHKISFNSLPLKQGESEAIDKRLADRYDLNLVSSTREIVYRNKPAQRPVSAVVYGGLVYDLEEEVMKREALAYQSKDADIGASSPASL